jgi:hypothetical protein
MDMPNRLRSLNFEPEKLADVSSFEAFEAMALRQVIEICGHIAGMPVAIPEPSCVKPSPLSLDASISDAEGREDQETSFDWRSPDPNM